jgi:hypothetical protein
MERYTLEDFEEYKQFMADNHINVEEFIDNINHIVLEKEQVCDFYICMNKIYHTSKELYYRLVHFIQYQNPYGAYIIVKYLLLDEESKISFKNKYIDRMTIFKRESENKDLFVREIYELSNDDELNNFMDYTDNFNNYKPLDISKLDNIKHLSDFILNYQIHGILLVIDEYVRINFIYNLNYYLSNKPTYKSMLKDGEVNISGYEDFKRRFESNIDMFMILWNYMFKLIPYYRKENQIKLHIDYLPSDRIYNIYGMDEQIITDEYKFELIITNLRKMIYSSNSQSSEDLFFMIFLKLKFNYDESNPIDEYQMLKSYRYIKNHNSIILSRIKQYSNSKL